MEKRIVQDVVPPNRRSIRKIPIERERPKIERPRDEVIEEPILPPRPSRKPPRRKRSFKPLILTFSVILSLIVLVFAFSLIYASATIKVTPKKAEVSVSNTFTAKKDAKNNEIQYEVMTISKEMGEDVPATPGKPVETKAKGTITLYNTTKAAQKLVVSTSVSNVKGNVYKLDHTVTVPAAKTVSGKTVAGSVDVGITASKAGEDYNMNVFDLGGDFKIVNFKGTAKYDTIYGRLKTDIKGGRIGITQVVALDVASSTRKQIENSLLNEAIKEAKAQTPEGYILFDGAHTVAYEILPTTEVKSTVARMSEKITFYGIIFKKDSLLNYIAKDEVGTFNGGLINSQSLENLTFTIVNKKDFKPQAGTSLTFSLKGSFTLVGEFPTNDLKNALAGKDVHTISTLLAPYGTIASADVIIRPFWKHTFPNDTDKIAIELKQ